MGVAEMQKGTDMTRKNTLAHQITLISGLLVLGVSSGLAQAGERGGGHRDGHRHSATCGCATVQYAGRITIDGCSTRITSGRGELAQIAGAFRRAGYRARVQDGALHVDYGHCRPSVRWQADDSALQIRWRWDGLQLSLCAVNRSYEHTRYERRREVRPVRRAFRYGVCG